MNRSLLLLALCQGLFLTNNVTFTAINGLVGLRLAPLGWMATLPLMAYVVGGALSTGLVARSQRRWGRQGAFQAGLVVAVLSCLACAWAAQVGSFWALCAATLVAGYYNANANLYRFAAAELAAPGWREKAVSVVLAGGLMGAVLGPNLATRTRDLTAAPFVGAYLALAALALVAMGVLRAIPFAAAPKRASAAPGRSAADLLRQPVFAVAALCGALGFGVMNLLMAATPLAMQQCNLPFADTAWVIEWHVVGMFAPGFFTGHLIARWGARRVMGVGVALNLACIAVALTGVALEQFLTALFLLGVGWNFLFTGSTTLAMQAYQPSERDRAQALLNLFVFGVTALSSLASGVLVTTQGWWWLNAGSLLPVAAAALALVWLGRRPEGLIKMG